MAILQRLRQKIIHRDYYLSSHAEEEMWNDDLPDRTSRMQFSEAE